MGCHFPPPGNLPDQLNPCLLHCRPVSLPLYGDLVAELGFRMWGKKDKHFLLYISIYHWASRKRLKCDLIHNSYQAALFISRLFPNSQGVLLKVELRDACWGGLSGKDPRPACEMRGKGRKQLGRTDSKCRSRAPHLAWGLPS